MAKKMTLAQKRLKAIEREMKKPVTSESSRRNLIACGILTKDGKVADPYREVIVKKK